MKRLLAVILLLALPGCYSDNTAIVESGRPVELHLRNMECPLKITISEIDGCDYLVVHSGGKGMFFRAHHYPECRNCKNHTWPDGQKPMKEVVIRDMGTYYIHSLDIGGHEYFTLGGWYSSPDDIIHRGHCKLCAKRKF